MSKTYSTMKTVGEILSEARNKLNLSLEEVEKETKIRKRVLEALEKGHWSTIPPTYLKGLLKNYSAFLGLDEARILAFFRREFDEKKNQLNQKPLQKKAPKRYLRLTPPFVTVVLIGIAALAIFTYLFIQYQSFTAPPKLEVYEPKDKIRVTNLEVNVVGSTWVDSIVKINGQEIQISPGGSFSVAVGLKEGENLLTITSANRFGKVSTVQRTVYAQLLSTSANESKQVTLELQILTKPTFISVEVDGKNVFQGIMLQDSRKRFEAEESIKIATENGGATKVRLREQEFFLGAEGERVEKEFR